MDVFLPSYPPKAMHIPNHPPPPPPPPPLKVKWLAPYDFFSANFGQVAKATDESLIKKYEDISKHDLKKSLSLKTLR